MRNVLVRKDPMRIFAHPAVWSASNSLHQDPGMKGHTRVCLLMCWFRGRKGTLCDCVAGHRGRPVAGVIGNLHPHDKRVTHGSNHSLTIAKQLAATKGLCVCAATAASLPRCSAPYHHDLAAHK